MQRLYTRFNRAKLHHGEPRRQSTTMHHHVSMDCNIIYLVVLRRERVTPAAHPLPVPRRRYVAR